ncbi:hypothetical protein C7444_11849 [Sphaerotilus hippei]|uniref:Uncharacterized protein n=1 Tax=Sphaerotilus hippei TaxID=744406 RepID=A0A318H410_9BURK|nr:hypothetical protein [Sphaerotilus hippei]PXW93680.1 hypothetical protein C7444_11849 [Sphaerotilus hippei]
MLTTSLFFSLVQGARWLSALAVANAALLAGALLTACALPSQAASGEATPRHVRVVASQFHAQCPLAGKRRTVLNIDSQKEWDSTLPDSTIEAAAGRKVHWSRQQVLLYATAPGKHDVRLTSPARGLMLSGGVLYWPVDEQVDTATKARGSRSCLITIVTPRSYWQRIKVIDPDQMRRRAD